MNIRTVDNLSDKLSRELSWRKKELSDLKYYMDRSSSGPTRRRTLSRCGVAMLYAHWEGFVKQAGRAFLEFVAMQRLLNRQLHPNLLTLSMRHQVRFLPETRKSSEFAKFTEFFSSRMEDCSAIPYKTAINTESNLSSNVFREIIWSLGVDYSPYKTREKFIDSSLLGRRNRIAHGEVIDIGLDDYDKMRDIVIQMMSLLKNQLENSALLKEYEAQE